MSEIVTIKIDGLDKVKSAFAKAPALVTSEMKNAIQKALILLQGSARQFVPKDTSNLGSQIKTEITSSLSGQVIADTNYALFVHEGTAPHWPPLEAIEPWARRHGIPAFLVARSIAQKGTKAQPFFQWAKEATERDVFDFFDTAIKNIITRMAT